MKKKFRTPPGYRAPLRSRAAITAWLQSRIRQNSRPAYGLFTFNVKLHHLKTDFAHLTQLFISSGEISNPSPRYLREVEAVYATDYDAIWQAAEETARDHVKNDSTARMLWNGEKEIAEWEFAGRSGGWLVLTEFDGTNLAGLDSDWLQDCSFRYLRNLYRFLVQCSYDFRRPESEVEYQAAFMLFANYAEAAGVLTDEQHAEKEASEAREAAEREQWEARGVITTRNR